MARIAVTRPMADIGLSMLRDAGHEVIVHEDWVMNEDQLKEFVAGADVILCMLTEQINDAVMEAAGPQLKMVATYNVGYDNIDLAAAKRRNLVVTNTAGLISSTAVAEHAVALMMAVARQVRPADNFLRSGQYRHWGPDFFTGQQLREKTVGIIGTGQIGTIFAHICHTGFDMDVLYYDVAANGPLEIVCGAERRSLDEVLAESDVVSVHVPLLPSTKHLLGWDQLTKMKSSAILVNTARGPIIDEVALVSVLRERRIYGAGLDVFEFEPYLAEGLAELDNVVVTPHIASATAPTREAMSRSVAENILAYLNGQAPQNLVKLPEAV